jgi:hypothetical protein
MARSKANRASAKSSPAVAFSRQQRADLARRKYSLDLLADGTAQITRAAIGGCSYRVLCAAQFSTSGSLGLRPAEIKNRGQTNLSTARDLQHLIRFLDDVGCRTISRFLCPGGAGFQPARRGGLKPATTKSGSHSSRPHITARLKRPTRKSDGAGRSSSPIWSCSAWGLPCRQNCSCRGALLPHHFTLTLNEQGGIFSVALSVSVSGPRPLAGTPPYGDRTFLPEIPCGTPGRLPVRQPTPPLSHFRSGSGSTLPVVLYHTDFELTTD